MASRQNHIGLNHLTQSMGIVSPMSLSQIKFQSIVSLLFENQEPMLSLTTISILYYYNIYVWSKSWFSFLEQCFFWQLL